MRIVPAGAAPKVPLWKLARPKALEKPTDVRPPLAPPAAAPLHRVSGAASRPSVTTPRSEHRSELFSSEAGDVRARLTSPGLTSAASTPLAPALTQAEASDADTPSGLGPGSRSFAFQSPNLQSFDDLLQAAQVRDAWQASPHASGCRAATCVLRHRVSGPPTPTWSLRPRVPQSRSGRAAEPAPRTVRHAPVPYIVGPDSADPRPVDEARGSQSRGPSVATAATAVTPTQRNDGDGDDDDDRTVSQNNDDHSPDRIHASHLGASSPVNAAAGGQTSPPVAAGRVRVHLPPLQSPPGPLGPVVSASPPTTVTAASALTDQDEAGAASSASLMLLAASGNALQAQVPVGAHEDGYASADLTASATTRTGSGAVPDLRESTQSSASSLARSTTTGRLLTAAKSRAAQRIGEGGPALSPTMPYLGRRSHHHPPACHTLCHS